MSSGFKVSNGVRHGGMLSPYMFCVYADALSRMLNNVKAGCFIGASLFKGKIYTISSDTHKLQLIKLHHFKSI